MPLTIKTVEGIAISQINHGDIHADVKGVLPRRINE